MNIQDIFNKVIALGVYDEDYTLEVEGLDYLGKYMCDALVVACYFLHGPNSLSVDEYKYAEDAIAEYIGDSSHTLKGTLKDNGLDSSFKARLAIYKNWNNRPVLDLNKEI